MQRSNLGKGPQGLEVRGREARSTTRAKKTADTGRFQAGVVSDQRRRGVGDLGVRRNTWGALSRLGCCNVGSQPTNRGPGSFQKSDPCAPAAVPAHSTPRPADEEQGRRLMKGFCSPLGREAFWPGCTGVWMHGGLALIARPPPLAQRLPWRLQGLSGARGQPCLGERALGVFQG